LREVEEVFSGGGSFLEGEARCLPHPAERGLFHALQWEESTLLEGGYTFLPAVILPAAFTTFSDAVEKER